MVNIKFIAKTVGAILPTLLLVFWTANAALVPGADVFLISSLQLILFLVYAWRV